MRKLEIPVSLIQSLISIIAENRNTLCTIDFMVDTQVKLNAITW